MPLFSVVDMDDELLDAAYPLVRWMAPDVSSDDWLSYARKARMRGGLLGLIGADDALFGMLTYRSEENLRRGRVFHVDNFIVFELNRAAYGRQALCAAAETLARQQGCAALEVRLDNRFAACGTAKAHGWSDLGHSLESVVLTKPLEIHITSTASVGQNADSHPGKDSHPAAASARPSRVARRDCPASR